MAPNLVDERFSDRKRNQGNTAVQYHNWGYSINYSSSMRLLSKFSLLQNDVRVLSSLATRRKCSGRYYRVTRYAREFSDSFVSK